MCPAIGTDNSHEIRSHLEEIYDTNVSAELISETTDRVLASFEQWQNRPLETL